MSSTPSNTITDAMVRRSFENLDEECRTMLSPWIEGQEVIGVVRDPGSSGRAIITLTRGIADHWAMYYAMKIDKMWYVSADVQDDRAETVFKALTVRFG